MILCLIKLEIFLKIVQCALVEVLTCINSSFASLLSIQRGREICSRDYLCQIDFRVQLPEAMC